MLYLLVDHDAELNNRVALHEAHVRPHRNRLFINRDRQPFFEALAIAMVSDVNTAVRSRHEIKLSCSQQLDCLCVMSSVASGLWSSAAASSVAAYAALMGITLTCLCAGPPSK